MIENSELLGVPAFAGLPEDQITWFISQSQEITLQAGDAYFREGDPADAMYVILSGEGQVRGGVGGELVTFEMKPGTVTGVLPFSRMKQFTYAARAITDVRALRFPASQFPDTRTPHAGLGSASGGNDV